MEIESKYSVADAAAFARWRAVTQLGAYALGAEKTQEVVDYYFDTPQWAFGRNGYACRLREKAGQWRATLKSLAQATPPDQAAVHQRLEYEVAVAPQALPTDWPASPARELALRLLEEEPWQLLCVIRQRRHIRPVLQQESAVAEWSLDEVTLGAAERTQQFWELEMELTPQGTAADLAALAQALAAVPEGGLQPQPLSKFERALAWAGIALEPRQARTSKQNAEPQADDTLVTAGRKILARHYAKQQAQAEAVRAGQDAEAIHDMRVATRRQRAALRLLAAHFRPKAVKGIQRGLRDLARCLGAVRDWDVLLEATQAYQAQLPAPQATALQPLLDAWQTYRAVAHEQLVAHLDSQPYHTWQKAYQKFLAAPEAEVAAKREPLAPTPLVRHVLPAEVWAHYGAVQAYETVFVGAAVETLHALRIAGKYLRYLLEFFREVLGENGKRAIKVLVALQDHLGELHDAEVALNLTRTFLAEAAHQALTPEVVRAIERYATTQQRRLHTLHRTALRPWRAVQGPTLRRWLGQAVKLADGE